LTDNYTDTNIDRFNEMIGAALDVLDRLIEAEDDARLRLAHSERGIDMAALVLDYEREARYLETVCASIEPTIDSHLVLGITYANCGYRKRAVAAMRDALRMLMSLDESFDEKSLTKFVYRITRHVGCVFSNAQELLSLVTFKGKEALRTRLDNTLECLDEAMEREKLLDFRDAQAHVFYGDLFEFIGLTRHALRHYDKAIELQVGTSEIDLQKVEGIRKQLDQLEGPSKGKVPTVKVQMNTTQMPNFNLQLGNLSADMESLIRDYSSDFHRDFIEDDAIFTRTV
jgi:tetratricopeptide (TPR) repeat protein